MFVPAITQSIRSVLFTLVPTAVITFLAWAIAGSAYASTSDPFRAAVWIFLAAHSVPFNLQIPPGSIAGWLTYLPIGAMVFPAIGILNGVKRTKERSDSELATWIFGFFYLVWLLLLTIISSNSDVTAKWYWALTFATPFVFILIFAANRQFKFAQPLVYLTKIWAILLGFAALLLGISLVVNFGTVHKLTTVLQPGILGGILLLILTLLYLPNFLISTLAYITGAGFAVGRDTLISPFTFELGRIPALPILGALPTGRHPIYILLALFVLFLGAQVAYWTLDSGRLVLRQTVILFVISTFLFGYLGSGALATQELGSIGPSLWKFPLVLSAEFLLGVGLVRLIPLIPMIPRISKKSIGRR